MLFSHLSFLLGLAGAAALTYPDPARCTAPVVRREWRDLSEENRQSYIDAVLCLKTKPSKIDLPTSLYDDFPFVHQKYNEIIHGIATFLPWHRYFTVVYENALHECGYEGSVPYWDWTRDPMEFYKSPVFADQFGFGYDGSDNKTETLADGRLLRCVTAGPFKDLRPSYIAVSLKELVEEEHCLFRNLVDGDNEASARAAEYFNSTAIAAVQTETTYEDYRWKLEGGPHGIIHSSIGGDMTPTTSPNEPLFFLHHAQIDRIWSQWQDMDIEAREYDYAGPTIHAGKPR
ncbi:hypothetical protein CkaCkLH20_09444 [Colletotrichum karsti]|uniref:Tyrosinase copper-binding domain-containing protein n=1 Tax=Colletotrichum karsti TaxID=1095194 RepID=A0A9P6HYU3_9PEZI|nr:uncharacterized protein CkaCkLH20_09444 [Colletotrichum karsti]KAF9872934.1 hypothetical protein CkaCkLH20_09444 [Colletotrichum karsti]